MTYWCLHKHWCLHKAGSTQAGIRGDDIDITPLRAELIEVESRLTDMGNELTVTDVIQAGPDWEPIEADSS